MESFSRKEKFIFTNLTTNKTLELSVLSSFYLDKADGIESMDNELYTSDNFAMDGVSLFGSNVKERSISFEGRIPQNLKLTHRPRLISFFNPKHRFTLKYTNGTIERYIDCVPTKTPVISKDIHPQFIINVSCPNPWWYSKKVRTDVAVWRGGFSFPLEIPQDVGIQLGYREPSLIVDILNTSDYVSPLKVEFRAIGTVSNPSILNVETLEKIEIETEMKSGDIITVNTTVGNEFVELTRNNVTTSIFNKLTIESNPHMTLDLGDNFIKYDAALNVENLEVTIYFTPQYVGV